MRKCFFIVCLFCFIFQSVVFVGCSYDNENVKQSNIMIEDKEYLSLAEAISEAKTNDCILIFDDVNETIENEQLKNLS